MKINFKTAVSLLLEGQAVALPTETVYGLAGRIDKEKTLEKIFLLKKRPLFDPLIVHCHDKKQILKYVSRKSIILEQLFDFFSPGPLTVIANKNKHISSLITAGKKTVAFRIPAHPLMRKILQQIPVPLAAPSANLYGKVSPVTAEHVLSSFKNQIPVLDGGRCEKGIESTIVFPDILKKKLFILRKGVITKEELEVFIKKNQIPFKVEYKKDVFQPGGSASHYKPQSPLYIIETEKTKKEIEKFLHKKFPLKKIKSLHLQSKPQNTARLLYSDLRKLSDGKENLIFVQKTKKQSGGLWEAIWDRLHKASSKYYQL